MSASIDARLEDLADRADAVRSLVEAQVPEITVYSVAPVTQIIEGLQKLRLGAMNAAAEIKGSQKEPSVKGFLLSLIGVNENDNPRKLAALITDVYEAQFRRIQPYVTAIANARRQGWAQVGLPDYEFKTLLVENLVAVREWTLALRTIDLSAGWGTWIIDGLKDIAAGVASALRFVGVVLKDAFQIFAWAVKNWWLVGGVVLGIIYRRELASGVRKLLPAKKGGA